MRRDLHEVARIRSAYASSGNDFDNALASNGKFLSVSSVLCENRDSLFERCDRCVPSEHSRSDDTFHAQRGDVAHSTPSISQQVECSQECDFKSCSASDIGKFSAGFHIDEAISSQQADRNRVSARRSRKFNFAN